MSLSIFLVGLLDTFSLFRHRAHLRVNVATFSRPSLVTVCAPHAVTKDGLENAEMSTRRYVLCLSKLKLYNRSTKKVAEKHLAGDEAVWAKIKLLHPQVIYKL